MKTAKSLEEVGRHFGVHRRTVHHWSKEESFPKSKPYDLEAIDAWAKAHGKGKYARTQASGSKDELYRLQSLEKKLEIAQQLGLLVDADTVERTLQRWISLTKARLEELPDRIAAKIAHLEPDVQREIRQDVEMEIRDTLLSISKEIEDDDEEDDEE